MNGHNNSPHMKISDTIKILMNMPTFLNILGTGGHAQTIMEASASDSGGDRLINLQTECRYQECLNENRMTVWILGFGDLKKRRAIIDQYKEMKNSSSSQLTYISVYHPRAVFSSRYDVSDIGTYVGANTHIGPHVKIGAHCIINTNASIEHDCVIGENVHISVGVVLCGKVRVDDDTFVGANTVITPGVHIGKRVFIGAGSKVDQDIKDDHFYDGRGGGSGVLRRSMCQTTQKSSEIAAAAAGGLYKKMEWCAKKPLDMNKVEGVLQKSVERNHYTNNGPVVRELEGFIKDKLRLKKKVHMASSGTGALHALIASLQMRANTILRFVTQAFTFPSAILGPLKDTIVVVDNDERSLGPSFAALEAMKADIDGIIVTNVFGCICDIDKYREWCDTNHKFLVFDSAASPVAYTKDGRNVCDIADASIISFHETKFLGRGEGGAVVCDDELWPYVSRAVNFGFNYGDVVRKYHIEASNWRMSDFSAAFILVYLQDVMSEQKFQRYKTLSKKTKEMLEKSERFHLLFSYPEDTIFSGICVRCEYQLTNEVVATLAQRTQIELKKYYVPLADRVSAPVAWDFYDHVICFPFHCKTTEEDVTWMIGVVETEIEKMKIKRFI